MPKIKVPRNAYLEKPLNWPNYYLMENNDCNIIMLTLVANQGQSSKVNILKSTQAKNVWNMI